jgi:hypothetical protein
MSNTKVIEFVISENYPSIDNRMESAIDAIVDQFIPSVASVAELEFPELAARLMLELAVVVGASHDTRSVMQLASAAVNCLNDGHNDASDAAGTELVDEQDQLLLDMECSTVFH